MNLSSLKSEITQELNDILTYWSKNSVDHNQGGFVGKISHSGKIDHEAEKGGVLNARILWTFSAAAQFTSLSVEERSKYQSLALRSFEYFSKYFFDKEHGGVYWSIHANSSPKESRKQIYGQAFAIYGLSEYYALTQHPEALTLAIQLYELIEKHSFDGQYGGYFEAFSQDWTLLQDLRLSEKDRNDPKTMNTHLHIIEGYVNLYKVWPNTGLRSKIIQLLDLFETHIIDHQTGHLKLFFDPSWKNQSASISFGHDIEASWLLHESAEVLKDPVYAQKWQEIALQMASATLLAIQADGSLLHEKDATSGHTDSHREWWVSAEAMVGFLNAYELSEEGKFLTPVFDLWNFVKKHLKDPQQGEWVWGVFPPTSCEPNYQIMDHEDKVGFWKCPYHNARACMEIIQRIA